MRRFTRLTNAFIGELGARCCAPLPALQFLPIHQTLRVTPAMEAGISDHVWSIEEMIDLLRK